MLHSSLLRQNLFLLLLSFRFIQIFQRLLLLKLLLVRSLLVAFLILVCLTLEFYYPALPAHSHLLQLSGFLGVWFLRQFLSSLSCEFCFNQWASVKKKVMFQNHSTPYIQMFKMSMGIPPCLIITHLTIIEPSPIQNSKSRLNLWLHTKTNINTVKQ